MVCAHRKHTIHTSSQLELIMIQMNTCVGILECVPCVDISLGKQDHDETRERTRACLVTYKHSGWAFRRH